IFFIERGRCRVVIERPPGAVTVALLADGDFFGEAACLLSRRQQASVYAQTDCYLLALDRQSLHGAMTRREPEALDELQKLSHQLSGAHVVAAAGVVRGSAAECRPLPRRRPDDPSRRAAAGGG